MFDVRKNGGSKSERKGNVMEERGKQKSTKIERMIRTYWRE
jgi:hypothetical protein